MDVRALLTDFIKLGLRGIIVVLCVQTPATVEVGTSIHLCTCVGIIG